MCVIENWIREHNAGIHADRISWSKESTRRAGGFGFTPIRG